MTGGVYQEFANELEKWRKRYAKKPRRELVRLFLLALEREQLVSVGYREELMQKRLAKMPIADDARNLIRHALLWVWKDEEMHTVYIRGALMRLGSAWLRFRSFVQQAMGALAGWASSIQQHVRWREAPFARLMATLIAAFGALLGKVPREVRKQLAYASFRDFCRYNIDAERTAALCWQRIGEVGAGSIAPSDLEAFDKIRRDEDRHARVFGLLADAFDDQDRLEGDESAQALARAFGHVGEFFLPRALRRISTAEGSLGAGGRVHVVCGAAGDDKRARLWRLLEESGLREKLEARRRSLGRDLRVAIKATFMLGYHQKDRSVVLDPELVAELARFLRAHGCADVAVVEAPNLYDRFFQHRSVAEVARYFGFDSPDYRVVDLGAEQIPHDYFRGLGQHSVGRTWKEADFRISLGKLRSHPVEHVALTVANLEGLGGRGDEFLFAERKAHRDTAILMLMSDFPPHFALLEGWDLAPDGLMGVVACRRPKSPRRLYAGSDAIAVDIVAARDLATDVRRSQVLRGALHWFGDPTASIEVVGEAQPIAGWRGPYHSSWSAFLSFWAYPMFEFASGRGALFAPEVDRKAFPPLGREGLALRAGRRAFQLLLSMRPPP